MKQHRFFIDCFIINLSGLESVYLRVESRPIVHRRTYLAIIDWQDRLMTSEYLVNEDRLDNLIIRHLKSLVVQELNRTARSRMILYIGCFRSQRKRFIDRFREFNFINRENSSII